MFVLFLSFMFLHLLFYLGRFWLRLQEFQRLVLESEDMWRRLQLHALHRDGLDQIELSWHAKLRSSFITLSEVKRNTKKLCECV